MGIKPVCKFESIREIIKPVLCLLNEISSQLNLEVDIKEDARYFFEFQLTELINKNYEIINEYYEKNFNVDNGGVLVINENIIETLIHLLKSQYRFSNEPIQVISSSNDDFYDIDLVDSMDYKRHYNIASIEEIASESLSNVYEYDFKAKKGKNVILFDFPFQKIFQVDMFKNLNVNDFLKLREEFIQIYNNITKNIKTEMIQRCKSNTLDISNDFVISMPSKRDFLKLACLNNYKELFVSTSGIYFYKYEDIKYDNNLMNDKIQDRENYITEFYKPEECKNCRIYTIFSYLYDMIVANLAKFLRDEVNED